MSAFITPIRPRHYKIAEEHALIRNGRKRDAGVTDEKVSVHDSSMLIDLWGALAEVVVAELLQAEAISYDQIAGDGGISDVEIEGKTYQIKWANHPTMSGFRPAAGKLFTADRGILATPVLSEIQWLQRSGKVQRLGNSPPWGTLRHMNVVGWLDQGIWKEKKEYKTIMARYGAQDVLERVHLLSFGELYDCRIDETGALPSGARIVYRAIEGVAHL